MRSLIYFFLKFKQLGTITKINLKFVFFLNTTFTNKKKGTKTIIFYYVFDCL